jgi:hypothetical protein
MNFRINRLHPCHYAAAKETYYGMILTDPAHQAALRIQLCFGTAWRNITIY